MFRDTLSGVPVYPQQAWFRLGEAIQRRRVRLGLTQAALAERAELSVNTIRHIEHGGPGRLLTLPKLAEALGWDPSACTVILDGGDPTIVDEPASRERAAAMPAQRVEPDVFQLDRPDGLSDEDWSELREMLAGTLTLWMHARSRRVD